MSDRLPRVSQGWNRISGEVSSAQQLDVWESARLFAPEGTPLVRVCERHPKWMPRPIRYQWGTILLCLTCRRRSGTTRAAPVRLPPGC